LPARGAKRGPDGRTPALLVDDECDHDVEADGREQAGADVDYFVASCGRSFSSGDVKRLRVGVLKAYRWQYIVSGVQDPRFMGILGDLTTPQQMQRIAAALGPIVN
jgi:hypothetical protein